MKRWIALQLGLVGALVGGVAAPGTPSGAAPNDARAATRPESTPLTGRGGGADVVGIKLVSNTKPGLVSGAEVLVRVRLPRRTSIDDARITVNERRVRPEFARQRNGSWLGLVGGLDLGPNEITVEVPSRPSAGDDTLVVDNHRQRGPAFSGTQQRPFFCETTRFGLDPAEQPYCGAASEVSYVYRNQAGQFAPLVDPDAPPPDVATVTVEGRELPYVVRIERGVIDRSVYEVAGIHGGAAPDPLRNDAGWNRKLVYTFGGGCNGGYHQGASTGGVVNDLFLSRGYVVASSSLNVLNNNCSPIISAEAAMMVKEHVIETYGPARYTIGWGGSGGAIQQYDIADAYPGIIDGILPAISFPDPFTTLGPVVDCALLDDYFVGVPGVFTPEEQTAIEGFRDPNTCGFWTASFFNRVTATGSCDGAIPVPARWNATTNPDGVRCSAAEQVVNQLGRDPETNFVRSALDNVGVQYGLEALEEGTITPAQFADLNANIGGVDYLGELVAQRSVADPLALERAYATDLVNSGGQGLATTPVIDLRNYRDESADIHTAEWSYVMRARMEREETAANQVILEFGDNAGGAQAYALDAMDRWLSAIQNDDGSGPRKTLVRRNRPSDLTDGCYLADGTTRIREKLSYSGTGRCATLYPIFSNPRLVAGEGLTRDALKCELTPLVFADYPVTFTRAQKRQLRQAFPDGVCDHGAPGIGSGPPDGAWQEYPDRRAG